MLLCTVGMILQGYLLNSIIMALLKILMPSKWVPMSLKKRKKLHRVRSGEKDSCSSTMMFLLARNCWMLSIPSPVTFQTWPNLWWLSFKRCLFSCLADLQSTDNCHAPPTLPVPKWLPFCLLKASYSQSHLLTPHDLFLNLLSHSKTHVYDMVLSPYTCWNISSVFDGVFLNPRKKFQVYLFFCAHSWMTRKRGVINKRM